MKPFSNLSYPITQKADGPIGLLQPLPGIGDMVWYIPHIHKVALLSSNKKAIIITRKRTMAHELFACDPHVDSVHYLEDAIDKPLDPSAPFRDYNHPGLVSMLRSLNLQRLYIVSHKWHYARLAYKAKIKQRAGYGLRWKQRLFLNYPPTLSSNDINLNHNERAIAYLQKLGASFSNTPYLSVDLKADKAISEQFKDYPKPWVILVPGASELYKQWPLDSFLKLAKLCHSHYGGSYFFLGGPQDNIFTPKIETFSKKQKSPFIHPTFHLPLAQSIALINQANLCISNDTGMLNISAALAKPVIGLFGATPPLKHSQHIYPIIPFNQKIDQASGMHNIIQEDVLEKVKNLLGENEMPIISADVKG